MSPLSSSAETPPAIAAVSSSESYNKDINEVIRVLEFMGLTIESQQREIAELKSRISKIEDFRPSTQTPVASSSTEHHSTSSTEPTLLTRTLHSVSLPSLPSFSMPKFPSLKLSSDSVSWDEYKLLLEARRKEGQEELNKRNYVGAKDIFKSLLDTIRECPYTIQNKRSELYQTYLLLSKCYEGLCEYTTAYNCAKDASEYTGDKSNARAQMAVCAALNKDFDEAKNLLSDSFSSNLKRKSLLSSISPERHLANALILHSEKKYFESFNEIIPVLHNNIFNTTAVLCLSFVVEHEIDVVNLTKMCQKLDKFFEALRKEKKPSNDNVIEIYRKLLEKKSEYSLQRLNAQNLF